MTATFYGNLCCNECGKTVEGVEYALTGRGVEIVPTEATVGWTAVESPRAPLQPTPHFCSDKCLLANDARKRLAPEVVGARVEIKKT